MKLVGIKRQNGFTIVELLVVILVIGILASITIVAYNGTQARARDGRRSSDAEHIVEALRVYRELKGDFPAATPSPGSGGYELSTDTLGTFMEYLTPTYFTQAPLDPTNNASHYYKYDTYTTADLAGLGCPTDKGSLMVFYIVGYEDSGNMPKSDDPLVCTGQTWQGGTTTYFKYKFQND